MLTTILILALLDSGRQRVMFEIPSCTYRLTASELEKLNDAVKNARPTNWMECYSLADVSTHCCDLIRWKLTLSTRSGRDLYITSFFMITPTVPDLASVADLLIGPGGLNTRYGPLCVSPR